MNCDVLQDFKADSKHDFRIINITHFFLNKLSLDEIPYIKRQEFLRNPKS